VVALGLNMQWGMTGLFNIGIAAFFAIGAYTTGILTTPPSPNHLGGFGLPFPIGMAAAMVTSGILALLVGLVTLRLRADYLAISTIGLAELVRLALKNEDWLTNGVRGMPGIPRPLGQTLGADFNLFYLALVLVLLAVFYWLCERARKAPWGRVLRALREDEEAAEAIGKNVVSFRLQSFIVGSSIMGLAGALYAHFFGFISPETFEPMQTTFLIWVMLIAGGSGNNRGAILGAFVIWGVFSATEFLTRLLPPDMITQAGHIRILLVGLLLCIILVVRPEGMLSEEGMLKREARRQDKKQPPEKAEP
jgi:branched-chain amino acid transport system permease protein